MKNKSYLALVLGIVVIFFVCFGVAQATQVFTESVIVPSLRVGQQGVGGVTYFNGTIINETTNDGIENPVTFGDDVRIDGRVFRGIAAGTTDSQPFIVNDNMEVVGSLTVGSTNILSAINAITGGDMYMSTYDIGKNSKIDANKLDSGIVATLIGGGTISNTEFGYLNGVTSNIQDQLNTKGIGDMLKATYDVGDNSKIDAGKLDSGIAATLIGSGGVSNAQFGYLTSLSLNNDTSMHLTALGIDAGSEVLTTGTDNTFLGYQAGKVMTTGDESVAIGSGAMALAESATSNIAIGYNAFGANTSGPDNVVIGHSAMSTGNGNANGNVAIGNLAMKLQAGGVHNVAVGYDTLSSGTNNFWNVAVGYQALKLATGNGNIGIGYKAGDNITTGGTNLIIGDDIDAASATSSNQLNIGGAITGDILTGLVTFNERKDVYDIGATPNRPVIDYSGAIFTNKDAGQDIEFILPDIDSLAAIGVSYTFIVEDSVTDFDITPFGTDQIMGLTDSASDTVRSVTEGDTVTLTSNGAKQWFVTGIYETAAGGWVDVP